jgi:hypothetical protein
LADISTFHFLLFNHSIAEKKHIFRIDQLSNPTNSTAKDPDSSAAGETLFSQTSYLDPDTKL